MRLAPDQAHRTTAKLTTNWGRRRLLFELDDLVHDATLRQASRPSILFVCNQCLRRCSRLHWLILLLGLGLSSFRNLISLLQFIGHLRWFSRMSKLLIWMSGGKNERTAKRHFALGQRAQSQRRRSGLTRATPRHRLQCSAQARCLRSNYVSKANYAKPTRRDELDRGPTCQIAFRKSDKGRVNAVKLRMHQSMRPTSCSVGRRP